MKPSQLTIATCQFAVSDSIQRNAHLVRRYIAQAADAGADLIHFPESALSGHAGIDFTHFQGYDWDSLAQETKTVMALAAEKKVWIVLGSAHRLETVPKPHNCLYLINPQGGITDRYDKRFCLKVELRRYTPGSHTVVFEINRIKCALLICFEVRFPELYRSLFRQGVRCVFQSFYNARQEGPSVHSDIMVQSMQCRAASNNLWVSLSNASAYYSPYGSCFIRPDGVVEQRLARNQAGWMLNTIDLKQRYYDPMKGFRAMAIQGGRHNGQTVKRDPRSKCRTCL